MSYPSDALRFANRVLKAVDCQRQETLAKGRRGNGVLCPIASTIHAGIEAVHDRDSLKADSESFDVAVTNDAAFVHASKWDGDQLVERHTLQVNMPKGALGFIQRFDAGKYPQFDRAVKAHD